MSEDAKATAVVAFSWGVDENGWTVAMRYEVDPTELAAEAADLGEAARQLGEVTVVASLGVLRQALPGGATAAAVAGIQEAWCGDLTASRAAVRSFGKAMAAAAGGYEQVEVATRRALDATS